MPETATASSEVKALVYENDDGWTIPTVEEVAKFSTAKCSQMMDELIKSELIPAPVENFSKMSLTDKREALMGVIKSLTGGEGDQPQAEAGTAETETTKVEKQIDLEEAIAEKNAETKKTGTLADELGDDKPKEEATNKKGKKNKKSVVSDDDPIVKYAHRIENIKDRPQLEEIIRDIQENEGANKFKIGGALARIQELELWKENYESFADYITTVTAIKYRTGMYAIEIYRKALELEASWDDFGGIGWTKIITLMPVLDKDNVKEWVEKAKVMNNLSLKAHVEELQKAGATGSAPKSPTATETKTKTFKLHPDQIEIVDAALAKAKKEGNTDNDAPALEYIVQSYLGGNAAYTSLEAVMTATRKKAGSAEEFVTQVFEIMEKLTPDLTLNLSVEPAEKAA